MGNHSAVTIDNSKDTLCCNCIHVPTILRSGTSIRIELQSVLDTVLLQAMEGKKAVALFLLLSALVATVYTRPQIMLDPKQSEAVPGSPQVGSEVKPDEGVIPRPRAQDPCCTPIVFPCCNYG